MDYLYILSWWFFLLLLGLINFPLTFFLLRDNTDKGYGLSKVLGLLFVSYLLFSGSVLKLIPFNLTTTFAALFILIVVNVFVFLKNRNLIITGIKRSFKIIIFQELLFLFALVFWSIIKTFNPEIRSLEKLMDYGFINAILKNDWQPVQDMWFAGKGINYYYFGHFYSAVATRLSFLPSAVTYNLLIATILGFLVNGVFSLISTVYRALPKTINKKAVSAAIVSFLLVSFAGNFHTPIYAFQQGIDKYWYPDATRFIGYNPETADKTIHEFPLYSFVVSDLHAHLLDLPVVVAYLSFLFMIFNFKNVISFKDRFLRLIVPGFLFGTMFMTNTWDFASYMLITGVVLLLSKIDLLKKLKNIPILIYDISLNIVIMFTLGLLFAVPFIVNFESIAQGVKLVTSHSPLWQLLILWGLPVILLISLSGFLFITKKVKKPDLFILGLLISSIILIIIPEIIYIKDIYIASHYRANTMFKITYQAFVVSYLTAGYVALRIITKIKQIPARILATTAFTLLFSALLSYPFFAVNSYFNKLEEQTGLDGTIWLKRKYLTTYNAIQYLKKNTKGQVVIAEAPGNSYSDNNIISSYTGLPSVQGWFVHEWLWRGNADLPTERNTDLDILYTSNVTSAVKDVISKYKIAYVIVGPLEKEKYPLLRINIISKLSKVVYSDGNTTIYQVLN